MMASTESPAHPKPALGATWRKDLWWMPPVSVVIGLTIGFGYLTWAAVLGNPEHGFAGNLISPVYSPPLHHWFPMLAPGAGIVPSWFSPALLVLWAPGGFRATCYYYRKAYYRAGFVNPPGCAVQGIPGEYTGETRFPLVLQNIHRYFMYLALTFVFIFFPIDIIHSMLFENGSGGKEIGMSLGTLVLIANAICLGSYTLGCHSLRHFIGGKLDCFSCETAGKMRWSLWQKVTFFNEKHMLWAWVSLAVVGLTDLFVRLVYHGYITNVRFF